MTLAAESENQSRNIYKRVTSKVSDVFTGVRDKTPDVEQVRDGITGQTERVGDAYFQLRGRDYVRLAQLFRDWAPSMEKDRLVAKELAQETEAFLAWQADLPEADQKDFIRGLYAFYASMNLDLNWLIDPEMAKYVEAGLKRTMGEILHMYCLTYWKSRQIQSDVEVFVKLKSWMDKPDDKDNAEFNQQVFTKLVAEDLIPSPPVELFLATEEERRDYSVEAIKAFIEDNTQQFYELLKTPVVEEVVVAAEEEGSGESEDEE